MPDALDCYELCVQSPAHAVALLLAAHGGVPSVLREDFSGTAAVSREWLAQAARRGDANARALAVDHDGATLERAAARAREAGLAERFEVRCSDCIAATDADPADVIFVGNFSIGFIHQRRRLVEYLGASRERLVRSSRAPGVFVCDTYGGASAYRRGLDRRRFPGRGHEVVYYTWIQESADPITAMVTNSISFDIERDAEIVERLPRVFVYHWRLWSIAELREAMFEAGFRAVEVHAYVSVAPGTTLEPVRDGAALGDNWIVALVARA